MLLVFEMAWDLKKELARKVIHLMTVSFIIIFLIISRTYGRALALLALVFLLIVFLELEYVRVELRKKIPFIWRFFREKEKERLGGQAFFLIGAIISLAVFDFDIAVTAILMTTFGDMAAALIGRRFGHIWITKTRALEGILAEFIVDLLIAYFILQNWPIVFVMAITATVVEAAIEKLDDNLIIPLFSGFNGQLIRVILAALNLKI